MERKGVPALLAPLGAQFRRAGVRIHNGGSFEGRPELLKSLSKVAEIMAEDGVHTFALCDFHPRHEPWSTAQAFRAGVAARLSERARPFLHLHFAMHDIESWLLCDRSMIAKMIGASEEKVAVNAEEIDLDNPPKAFVKRLFRAHKRPYRETTEGIKLLSSLNIERVYRRCRYFKVFLDDIAGTFALDLAAILNEKE